MSYRGRYRPQNPSKYVGDFSKVTYRSLIELKFMRYLDTNTSILYWSSEETVIPYISPKDNKYHRYFMDFKMWIKRDDGRVEVYLIEIKPKVEIGPPRTPKKTLLEMNNKQRFRFNRAWSTWKVNKAKWDAAFEYCKKEGFVFKIINEDFVAYDYNPEHWIDKK